MKQPIRVHKCPSSISPSSWWWIQISKVEHLEIVKANLHNSRRQMQLKRFTRQPPNCKSVSICTNLLKSPRNARGSHGSNLVLPSWRPQITEAWSHVDGARIRLVMGRTIFPRIKFLAKPKTWLSPVRILTDRAKSLTTLAQERPRKWCKT